MLQRSEETVRELREITTKTDTRDILSHATIQAEALEDYFLVDIDAHVTETQFWPEILDLIDNDVIRHMGQAVASRPGTSTALLNSQPGTLYQHVYGRIPHQVALAGGCGRNRVSPFHRTGTSRYGFDGPRLSSGLPDADASARHASAG